MHLFETDAALARMDEPCFAHTRCVRRPRGSHPTAAYALWPGFDRQMPQKMFNCCTCAAEPAHLRVSLARSICGNSQNDAAPIGRHVPGRHAANIEPGCQPPLDRKHEAAKIHHAE